MYILKILWTSVLLHHFGVSCDTYYKSRNAERMYGHLIVQHSLCFVHYFL